MLGLKLEPDDRFANFFKLVQQEANNSLACYGTVDGTKVVIRKKVRCLTDEYDSVLIKGEIYEAIRHKDDPKGVWWGIFIPEMMDIPETFAFEAKNSRL